MEESMDTGSESLKKMADILDKIKALLKENGASMGQSIISTEYSYDKPYEANITIYL